MGVDWHGLAIGLPQNYTKKTARKLRHILVCGSVLGRRSPGLPAVRPGNLRTYARACWSECPRRPPMWHSHAM